MRNLMLTIIAVCVMMLISGGAFASMNQSFDYGGLHAYSYASNYENECYASMNLWLEQGFGGRYYKYESASTDFYTYDWDPAQFRWGFSAIFKIVDEATYVKNMSLNLQQNMNVDLFDVRLNSWSEIRNQENWFWEEDGNGGYNSWSVLTDNPEISAGFNLLPAQIDTISLNLDTWWSWTDKYFGQANKILSINFSVLGHFLDTEFATAEEIGFAFVSAVPEPATMILLSFGGLMLRRRRGN